MTEMIFCADDKYLGDVTGFIEEALENAGCSMKTIMQVTVCTEEIFVNIAHYAYPEGEGDVSVCIDEDAEMISIIFTDSGIPFNPLEKKDPDITLSADERDIGGLGIFMVKKSMDKVDYERKDGKNIFRMAKKKG